VMLTPQATRARLRIGRCYPGQALEVGVSTRGFWPGAYQIVYQLAAALAKALVLAAHLLTSRRVSRPGTDDCSHGTRGGYKCRASGLVSRPLAALTHC
jgi:hypothetical protein